MGSASGFDRLTPPRVGRRAGIAPILHPRAAARAIVRPLKAPGRQNRRLLEGCTMGVAFHRSGALVFVTLVAAVSVVETQSGPQSAPAPASAPPTGLIVGKTVDGVTGAVIGGAIVSISRALPPAGTIRTDEPTPF